MTSTTDLLDNLVFQGGNADAVASRRPVWPYFNPPRRHARPIRSLSVRVRGEGRAAALPGIRPRTPSTPDRPRQPMRSSSSRRSAHRSASVVMWCKSAVSSLAAGFLVAALQAYPLDRLSTRSPDPASGTCFGLANSPCVEAASLRQLRRSFRSLVRRFHRYSCLIRLLHSVHHRDTESSFPLRHTRVRLPYWGRMKTSQVPTEDVRTCMGSPTPLNNASPPSPQRSTR